ncbi:MAG: hypothetical protein ACRDKZ_03920, partial [Actinomycetota bacterium]
MAERTRQQQEVADLEQRIEELMSTVYETAPRAPGTRYIPPPELYEATELREQLAWEQNRLEILNRLADDLVANPRWGEIPGAPREITRQVLLFDPSEDGRIAELHGAMDDRTRDIGIFVPGAGADLNGFQVAATRAGGLAKESRDQSLALISWLGYDAPD